MSSAYVFWSYYYISALYKAIDWITTIWILLTSSGDKPWAPDIDFSLFSAILAFYSFI
jgi:hypothetical protein